MRRLNLMGKTAVALIAGTGLLCAEDGKKGELTAEGVVKILEQQVETMSRWEFQWRRVLHREPKPSIVASLAKKRQELEAQVPKDKYERTLLESQTRQSKSLEDHFSAAKTSESRWVLRLKSISDFDGKHFIREGDKESLLSQYSGEKLRRELLRPVDTGNPYNNTRTNVLFNTLGGTGPVAIFNTADQYARLAPATQRSWSLENVTEQGCTLVFSFRGERAFKAKLTRPSFACTRISRCTTTEEGATIYEVPQGTPMVETIPFLPHVCEKGRGTETDTWYFISATPVEAESVRKAKD